MKQDLTEMIFILDRSGSMSGLEQDTIGGFNAMIERQKQLPGQAVITTVLFDDQYEVLHERIDLKLIAPLSDKQYTVRGMTALLDALGRAIQTTIQHRRKTPPEQQPAKTIFVITTDGAENASWEYSVGHIRRLIKQQTDQYGWEFLFLGANIDAVKTASDYGIASDRAAQFHADAAGLGETYLSINRAIGNMRTNQNRVDGSWKDELEADFKSRQKQ